MTDTTFDAGLAEQNASFRSTSGTTAARLFAWLVVTATFAFVINNYLTHWQEWPGIFAIFGNSDDVALGLVQGLIFVAIMAVGAIYVLRSASTSLRTDAEKLHNITCFIIRAAFWSVFLVGLVDMVISFLRVEGLLEAVVGPELTTELGRPLFRGPYVHMPLIALSVVIAVFSRSIAFPWLALLVVIAELMIVISRFIFSYEQAFMGDLVRFWYAALFLFASAYTLYDDGHVRVDVAYAGLSDNAKGLVNAIGAVVLGMALCTVVITLGMWTKSSIINSAILSFEVTQAGFGMYVKYLMAAFLGVFAVSMMVEFASTFLTGIADYRGDPGARERTGEAAAH